MCEYKFDTFVTPSTGLPGDLHSLVRRGFTQRSQIPGGSEGHARGSYPAGGTRDPENPCLVEAVTPGTEVRSWFMLPHRIDKSTTTMHKSITTICINRLLLWEFLRVTDWKASYIRLYIYRLVSSLNPHLINPHSGTSANPPHLILIPEPHQTFNHLILILEPHEIIIRQLILILELHNMLLM